MMRTTLRSLARQPWFSAAAVLTIALGVAANVAIFALVNHVLLRPLPYPDPDRLVWISTWNADRGQYSKSSAFDYDAWKSLTGLFDGVEAFYDRAYTLTGTDHPEGLVAWQFTPRLFSMLGTGPALGRTFSERDVSAGNEELAVLSDQLWRRRFDASRDVVGRSIELDGRAYAIAGVMPDTFAHPYPNAQLWTPVRFSSAMLADRKQRPLRVVARLKPGVTRERAEAELQRLAREQAAAFPDTHAGFDVRVRPLRDLSVGNVGQLLWVIQGTAAILLLIAAANVASLVLVRAAGRQRETAVRLALGATRLDLLRHHLAEGLVLATLGAAGGLAIAAWCAGVLPALLEARLGTVALPARLDDWIDLRVVLTTVAATAGIGILFGVTPLVRRPEALDRTLRTAMRGATGDRRTVILRHAIVGGQVALAVVLLVGAGLVLRSFARLQQESFGFETGGVVTAQLLLPRDRYTSPAQSTAFLDQLVSAVAALPGVESAALVNTLPLTGANALRPHNLPGRPPQDRLTEFRIVTPGYFKTMGIAVKRGRTFDDRDRAGAPDTIVVNETAARRLWPGADPIGQRLMIPDMMTFTSKEVIGVVEDTRHHDLARAPEPEVYRPASQASWPFFGLVIRTSAPAGSIERSLRDAAARVDRHVPISNVKGLSTLAESTLAWRRSSMLLLTIFAVGAALLAVVGVYGVMAYGVAQRTREIGVRIALGARPIDIARSVAAQGAMITAAGTGAGLAVSSMAAGVLGSLLFGIAPLDLRTFAAVAGITLVAGALASIVPALTAVRTDPSAALTRE